MCIIVIKPEGVQCPNEDILRNCFDSNPHGAGFARLPKKGKEVIGEKGFMTFKSFFTTCKSEIRQTDIAIYHFRITTSGGTCPENCHPFPISQDVAELKSLHFKGRYAFAHNGIFGQGDEKLRLSDTQLFIRDALYPLRRDLTTNAHSRARIKNETQGSRTVTIDALHRITFTTGNWITDKETGLIFSNTSYQQHASYFDPYDFGEGFFDSMECPICGSYNTDTISERHELLECGDCGCLFDSGSEVWAI